MHDITSGNYDRSVVTLTAPLWQTTAGDLLVPAFGLDAAGGLQPLTGEAGGVPVEGIELGASQGQAAGSHGIARVTGMVRVDPDGRRRIAATAGKPVAPIALRLRELLANSAVYEGQVVAVEAGLLLNANSSLLVDEIGAGGVPAASAQQVKLAEPAPDAPVLRQLVGGQAETVVVAEAAVVGMWREGRLMVFWVERR